MNHNKPKNRTFLPELGQLTSDSVRHLAPSLIMLPQTLTLMESFRFTFVILCFLYWAKEKLQPTPSFTSLCSRWEHKPLPRQCLAYLRRKKIDENICESTPVLCWIIWSNFQKWRALSTPTTHRGSPTCVFFADHKAQRSRQEGVHQETVLIVSAIYVINA